jgi:hypothetical protein
MTKNMSSAGTFIGQRKIVFSKSELLMFFYYEETSSAVDNNILFQKKAVDFVCVVLNSPQ